MKEFEYSLYKLQIKKLNKGYNIYIISKKVMPCTVKYQLEKKCEFTFISMHKTGPHTGIHFKLCGKEQKSGNIKT